MTKDSMLELLRLLADGAEPEQIEDVQAPPGALSLAVAAARRMADHRGRERSLHALVDSARELSATTDPSGVLDAIVRRARALMGTDTAYLTLHDPERNDTFVRAVDGAVSPQFRVLRIPLGIGLGGKVAETMQAWWTEEYGPDMRFTHSTTIDAGVGEEGLVGICGTPLVVEGEFVGVLFAANRTRRTFTPHEVSLLGSLATIAALSIRQARARVEIERALEEASLAHEAERRRTEDVIRSAEAHDRFTQLVAQGGGVDDITALLADLLGGWAVVIDADGTRRSASGPVPEPPVQPGQLDPLAQWELAESARHSDRGVADGTVFAVAVRGRSDVLALLLCGAEELTPLGWRTAERAGAVTALVLMTERDKAVARQRAHSDLVAELIGGSLDRAESQRLLHREGLQADVPYCLVAVRGKGRASANLASAVASLIGDGSIVGEHDRTVIALVPGEDPGAAAAGLVRRVKSTTATAAGVGPLSDPDEVPDAYAEATRTLDAMRALGLEGTGRAAGDLGFAGLMVSASPDVQSFVERTIGPLLDWDSRRGTDLVATAEAYFASSRSPRRASEGLHVHTNTVVQRLDRIAELLGADWLEPDRALEIQLALRLRRIMRSG